jgi:hypothetical protein
MSYSGVVTAIMEHATLADMDESTATELAEAADAYQKAVDALEKRSADLRAAIIDAARNGERPADIVRAIRHVYTYEYVGRLIRKDRAAQ